MPLQPATWKKIANGLAPLAVFFFGVAFVVGIFSIFFR